MDGRFSLSIDRGAALSIAAVLGFTDAVGRFDEFGRVIASGSDVSDEFGQLRLVPLDLLGQVSGHANVAVTEMNDTGVLAFGEPQRFGLLGVAQIDGTLDVLQLHHRVGDFPHRRDQRFLPFCKRYRGGFGKLSGRYGRDLGEELTIYAATSDKPRSEVLLRRHCAS